MSGALRVVERVIEVYICLFIYLYNTFQNISQSYYMQETIVKRSFIISGKTMLKVFL